MKSLSIILWTLLCVATALLFITAIFIHTSVITFLLAFSAGITAYNWWFDEIRYISQ